METVLTKRGLKAQIGIKEKDIENVVDFLNKLLADETVLYTKMRHAHWNVEGKHFHTQHLFFETLYGELANNIDDVAERVRSLGHYAVASMAKYLELTHLQEIQYEDTDSEGLIRELLSDYESVVMILRQGIELADASGDAGTSDFLTGLMEKHEKTAWMLRAHLA